MAPSSYAPKSLKSRVTQGHQVLESPNSEPWCWAVVSTTTDAGYEFPSGCLFSSLHPLLCPLINLSSLQIFPFAFTLYMFTINVEPAYFDSPVPLSYSLLCLSPFFATMVLWSFLMVFYQLDLAQGHNPCLLSGKWALRHNHHLVLEVPFTNEKNEAQNWSRSHMPGPIRRGIPCFHPWGWPWNSSLGTMSLL